MGETLQFSTRQRKKKLQNFQPKSAVHPGKYTNMGTWNHAGFARFSVTGDKAILTKPRKAKKKKVHFETGSSEASPRLSGPCGALRRNCLSGSVGWTPGCYDVCPLLREAPSGKWISHRMMDGNYPTSSFADALAPPAQTVASWAYDRSTASVKPR